MQEEARAKREANFGPDKEPEFSPRLTQLRDEMLTMIEPSEENQNKVNHLEDDIDEDNLYQSLRQKYSSNTLDQSTDLPPPLEEVATSETLASQKLTSNDSDDEDVVPIRKNQDFIA